MAQVEVVTELVHQSSSLLLNSPSNQSDLKVIAWEFSTSRTAGRADLLVGKQRIVESKPARIVWSKVSRIGFYRVETSDSRTTSKTKSVNVEKILVGNSVTDVYVKRYTSA
jgi:hypothetical protein